MYIYIYVYIIYTKLKVNKYIIYTNIENTRLALSMS